MPAVIDHVTGLYLDGLDTATRRSLDAAAVVRRPTRSLLEAMLGDGAGEEAWRRLDALPFTETGADGLVLHDTVARPWMLPCAPAIRPGGDGCAPPRSVSCAPRPVTRPGPSCGATPPICCSSSTIRSSATGSFPRAHRPSPSSTRPPTTARPSSTSCGLIRAAREPPSRPAGGTRSPWVSASPATAPAGSPPSCCCASRPRPAPASSTAIPSPPHGARICIAGRCHATQRVLFVRLLLTRDAGEAPGPAQAALWVDAKRVYMELRPDLRRVYLAVSRLDVLGPLLRAARIHRTGGTARLRRRHPASTRSRSTSVRAPSTGGSPGSWSASLHSPSTRSSIPPPCKLRLKGRQITLTQLEYVPPAPPPPALRRDDLARRVAARRGGPAMAGRRQRHRSRRVRRAPQARGPRQPHRHRPRQGLPLARSLIPALAQRPGRDTRRSPTRMAADPAPRRLRHAPRRKREHAGRRRVGHGAGVVD